MFDAKVISKRIEERLSDAKFLSMLDRIGFGPEMRAEAVEYSSTRKFEALFSLLGQLAEEFSQTSGISSKAQQIRFSYNFTDQLREVVAVARKEAEKLRHGYIGTEHILLALIRENEGVAILALHNLQIDPDRVRESIENECKPGKKASAEGELPFTSRAKLVLELAMSEAREMKHAYVGAEHLLLGLLREEKGIAAHTLIKQGISLEVTRATVLKILSSPSML